MASACPASPADAVPSDRSATVPLAALTGVRADDADGERRHPVRDRSRLVFTPMRALTAILLLVAALCASLTMLVEQAVHYQRALAGASVSSSGSGYGSGGDGSQSGDGDAGRRAADGADDGSDGSGDVGGDPGGGEPAGEGGVTADGDTDASHGGSEASGAAGEGCRCSGSGDSDDGDTVPESPGAGAGDGLIDLNTATSEELQRINGIGPVTAERILAYRRRIGRFTGVDQLMDVEGVGVKTLDKLRSQVTVR